MALSHVVVLDKKDRDEYVQKRDMDPTKMTAAQIVEPQKLAREWSRLRRRLDNTHRLANSNAKRWLPWYRRSGREQVSERPSKRLQEYAMNRGVRGFVAEILPRNNKMLRLAAGRSAASLRSRARLRGGRFRRRRRTPGVDPLFGRTTPWLEHPNPYRMPSHSPTEYHSAVPCC